MSTTPTNPLSQDEQIIQLQKKLAWAEMLIQKLQEELRLERIKKYGPASEKLDSAQLELLELEPGVSHIEVAKESQRGPLPSQPNQPRRHPGRQELPADLPRVEKVIPCTPEQCTCKACGQPTAVIGYDESEHLDAEPVRYFVVVTKREKRVCKHCEAGGVATAPAPARIIEKSLVSDGLIIQTVVAKYCDHLPLYRQSAILEREAGLEISRATLDGWVMRVGELLIPIVQQMRRELLEGIYIQADETTVDVQMHDGRGQNHQAYLWQYGRPGGGVVFDFRLGRGRDGPKEFLGAFNGLLQADGYIAYEHVGGPKIVLAGCWSHARRKFFEAAKLNPEDRLALHIVALIDELFGIDGEARDQCLEVAARDVLRQARSRPLVARIREQVEAAQREALPSSALGKAAAYALGQWDKLTRFLEYPELELSNNLAENSMRPVALGRKNWIHVGSRDAGPKVTAILSIVETCRRLRIPVREYLAAVLPGLANFPVQRVAEITPSAWTARDR